VAETTPTPGDVVRVTVSVALPALEAFRVFTEEIDQWWRRGRRFRNAPHGRGFVAMEPGVGGRVFESFGADDAAQLHEIGRVSVWLPGERLVFNWRGINFAPGESTEVEVQFRPMGGSTHVTVVHRGWAALRAEHPVRHGQDVPAFVRTMGLWWGDLLSALREHVQRPRP
jgi:Activator of Hsp90 ATPase homolog 1-like protein